MSTAVADLTFREAALEDVAFVNRVWNETYPFDPWDEEAKRHKWQKRSEEYVFRRFIAMAGADPVGWCAFSHQKWELLPERVGRIETDILPSAWTRERFAAALAHAEDAGLDAGAEILLMWSFERTDWRMRLLKELGYEQYGVEEIRELDLEANRDNLLAMRDASRRRMHEHGIRLTTMAELDDPEKWHKLHACFVEAEQDTPHTHDFAPPSFDTFMQSMNRPGIHLDRIWVAVIGDRIVGETELEYPLHSENVWTSWTGVAREARNRGVARALKLECFAQAMALGVRNVRTSNDERNSPMLHINDDMGYVKIPGLAKFRKRVEAR